MHNHQLVLIACLVSSPMLASGQTAPKRVPPPRDVARAPKVAPAPLPPVDWVYTPKAAPVDWAYTPKAVPAPIAPVDWAYTPKAMPAPPAPVDWAYTPKAMPAPPVPADWAYTPKAMPAPRAFQQEPRRDYSFDYSFDFNHDFRFDHNFDFNHDFNFSVGHNFEPRQQRQWYQDDPADSLYRAAYGLFSRQEYRQAATRFSDVRTRFPSSRYFCDAAYYEAFARYRLGTPADLRTGYQVLESMGNRCTQRSRREDVPELTGRINSALARLGDAPAAERLRRAASEGQNVCDSEERNVKIAALTALAQMDPENANNVLRAVLGSKDPCSAPIRRQAIALVARRNDPESVGLLGQIARNDADRSNQLEAVRALGRMNSDAAYAALEEFIRNSNDERVQMEAASAMARSDHARAQTAIRALIERTDVAERIRAAAISSLAARPNISLQYWQSLYGRVESDELRKAVLTALARTNTDAAQQFLLTVARNPSESSAARDMAVQRIRTTAPVAELHRLLQTADSRSMRMSIVSGLSARKEAEATDALIEIAKTSTDPEVRSAAVRALSQSHRRDDPKVVKALGEIAAGCCL